MQEIINHVKDFVEETNEIVIFGLKEFPIGKKYFYLLIKSSALY